MRSNEKDGYSFIYKGTNDELKKYLFECKEKGSPCMAFQFNRETKEIQVIYSTTDGKMFSSYFPITAAKAWIAGLQEAVDIAEFTE